MRYWYWLTRAVLHPYVGVFNGSTAACPSRPGVSSPYFRRFQLPTGGPDSPDLRRVGSIPRDGATYLQVPISPGRIYTDR